MHSLLRALFRLLAVGLASVLSMGGPATAGGEVAGSACNVRPLVIAHRGASGTAPENTMSSFEQAVKLGADMIELDVHASRDGRLIVIHDSVTIRTAAGNPQGAVADLTLEQLKTLDVGVWKGREFAGERIPTLGEALAAFKGRTMVLIELKARGIEEEVARIIRETGMEDGVMLQSFDAESMRTIRGLLPGVRTGVLYRDIWIVNPASRGRQIAQRTLSVGASFAGMNFGAISPALVMALKDEGIDVFAWTADEDWIFARLIDAGVDGIITNRPERLRKFLSRSAGE